MCVVRKAEPVLLLTLTAPEVGRRVWIPFWCGMVGEQLTRIRDMSQKCWCVLALDELGLPLSISQPRFRLVPPGSLLSCGQRVCATSP